MPPGFLRQYRESGHDHQHRYDDHAAHQTKNQSQRPVAGADAVFSISLPMKKLMIAPKIRMHTNSSTNPMMRRADEL